MIVVLNRYMTTNNRFVIFQAFIFNPYTLQQIQNFPHWSSDTNNKLTPYATACPAEYDNEIKHRVMSEEPLFHPFNRLKKLVENK